MKIMTATAVIAAALLAAPIAQAEPLQAKFSVTLPQPTHQGFGGERFAEIVNAKAQGRIAIKVFYGAQLGNDVQVTSALQGGTIEMVVPQTTTLVGMVKEYAVLDLPFLFANEAEAEAVLDGPVGKALLAKLPEKGLVGLGYWENGFFNTTTSNRAIARVEDFQGLKYRAIQSPISIETLKALGANPVPLAVPEVYPALETRTVDAQGTPTAVVAALKFYEVQKFFSATRHSYGAFIPLVSKKFWDKLTPADQKIMLDAAQETGAHQRKVAREAAAKALKLIGEKGLAINEVSPAEFERMRAKVQPIYDRFGADVGPELMQMTNAELARVRKR
ncbi:MAG: TRAP transporter substrate-binding protein [Rhodospirillales bacterium]|nr:TRAP transporter substrate-binding protein [Rhodospirillales bacterium]